MKPVPIHKDEDRLIVPPLDFTRPDVAEVLIRGMKINEGE